MSRATLLGVVPSPSPRTHLSSVRASEVPPQPRPASWLRRLADALARGRTFRVGDPVIYRMAKVSPRPGPRALDVAPAAQGDDYSYVVDKLWRVVAVRPDGALEITTRRGKRRVVDPSARQLRHPSWLERWRYRDRFPSLDSGAAEQ